MTLTNQFPKTQRILSILASTAALTFSFWIPSTLAADPFGRGNTHNIGNNTEAAFNAAFKDGNYKEATRYLSAAESSEPNEPLVYALQASFAYTAQDWNALKLYSAKTLTVAQQLTRTDPLRGNLYTAVGHFLEGGYKFQQEGALSALGKLQQGFPYLDEAKKIDANDPELNLINGYIELILAVNLPFSDPSQAIRQLEKQAKPSYLANRGIALGYRDLKRYDKALEFVNKALQETPNNPEVHYLKAQIQTSKGNRQKDRALLESAKKDFQLALAKPDQLPKGLAAQIFLEQCRNQNNLDNKGRDCFALRNPIQNGSGTWGPAALPRLE